VIAHPRRMPRAFSIPMRSMPRSSGSRMRCSTERHLVTIEVRLAGKTKFTARFSNIAGPVEIGSRDWEPFAVNWASCLLGAPTGRSSVLQPGRHPIGTRGRPEVA
jgi:hypothetical protein